MLPQFLFSLFSVNYPEAVVRRSSVKKVFLKILQNSNCLIRFYFCFHCRFLIMNEKIHMEYEPIFTILVPKKVIDDFRCRLQYTKHTEVTIGGVL